MNQLYQYAHEMPWKMNDGPHGSLDVVRGCNCICDACYNDGTKKIKPFDEIVSDFETLYSYRKVSAISLVGGEPLLHPDIEKIILFLKKKNMAVEILTNGILLDENMARKLAKAGADTVYLHIDVNQKRPDIIDSSSKQEVDNLRTQKAKLLQKHGIEVAMSITLDNTELGESLSEYFEYFKKASNINYFLLTLFKDRPAPTPFTGFISEEAFGSAHPKKADEPDMEEVVTIFKDRFNIYPYWYVSARHNKQKPRWVSYLYVASYDKKGNLKSTLDMFYSDFEGKYIEKYRKKQGKYPYAKKQSYFFNFLFILLNGLFRRSLLKSLKFLISTFGCSIILKRIFVQEPASINEDGKLEHCISCPDATVKNGKLIPTCVSDYFE